jgi:hypothetical protein
LTRAVLLPKLQAQRFSAQPKGSASSKTPEERKEHGSKGGKIGGKARWAGVNKAQRKKIAKKAAKARWGEGKERIAFRRNTKMSALGNLAGDETPIWRYMDLPRFVAMLGSQSIWFAKAARFEDGYEGFCQVQRPQMPQVDRIAKAITKATASGVTKLISLTEMLVDMAGRSADYFDNAREHLYVNSWCLADESMAMWEIYGGRGHGIALKSTVGKYRSAARFNLRVEQYAFGPVQYDLDIASNQELNLDLRQGAIPLPGPGVWEKLLRVAFHKRTCFEYEREWRAALYQDPRPDHVGCKIEFDLSELINAVYVGPRADSFLQDVTASIMEKFGLAKPLQRSALLQNPSR